MTVKYQNFRNETYYLHSKVNKKGTTTYHFSKKDTGTAVEEIPDGYEIYENPNGQVFLRKSPKKVILEDELKVIQTAMKKFCPIKDFKLDVKKDIIYIYTVTNKLDDLESIFPIAANQSLDKYKEYETVMRFRLMDKNIREFAVERFVFLSGIEDWMELEISENLQVLAKEYVRHIGEESFFDLF